MARAMGPELMAVDESSLAADQADKGSECWLAGVDKRTVLLRGINIKLIGRVTTDRARLTP